jgi:hypothetical protein
LFFSLVLLIAAAIVPVRRSHSMASILAMTPTIKLILVAVVSFVLGHLSCAIMHHMHHAHRLQQ